jgi:hypothetical protein
VTNQGRDLHVPGIDPQTGPAPDQLRALAEDASAAALASSTHPVDRVQSCRYAAALRAAADEVDRLRAVIENAPHENTRANPCNAALFESATCTCWKAYALWHA